jgi:hypothetical protein
MNRFLKTTILSAAVAATTLATLPASYAGDGHFRHDRHRVVRNSDGDLVVAGILGLAAGAIVAGALAQPEPRGPVYRVPAYDPYDDPDYYEPAPRRYEYAPEGAGYGTGYAYDGGLEPWSPSWFRYCEDRYRTFDPSTGTFTGYDGEQHFCQP